MVRHEKATFESSPDFYNGRLKRSERTAVTLIRASSCKRLVRSGQPCSLRRDSQRRRKNFTVELAKPPVGDAFGHATLLQSEVNWHVNARYYSGISKQLVLLTSGFGSSHRNVGVLCCDLYRWTHSGVQYISQSEEIWHRLCIIFRSHQAYVPRFAPGRCEQIGDCS